jgi:predicted ribosomally synthesized peptide with SipW-like signal peptide
MNKVLASLLMIGMVAAMAGAGTFAQFSDTETSKNNVITAGEIDLVVNGQNPLCSAVVEIDDIKPCWSQTFNKKVVVRNNPGYLYVNLTDIVNDTGVADFPDPDAGPVTNDPEYEAEGMTYDCATKEWTGDHAPVDDISTQIDYKVGLYTNNGGLPGTLIGSLYTYTTLNDAAAAGWIHLTNCGVAMNPGTKYWVVQTFHMNGDAGNEYQGDACTFTEQFKAEQTGDTTP